MEGQMTNRQNERTGDKQQKRVKTYKLNEMKQIKEKIKHMERATQTISTNSGEAASVDCNTATYEFRNSYFEYYIVWKREVRTRIFQVSRG